MVGAEEIRDEIHAFFGCTIANTLRPVFEPARVVNLMSLNVKTKTFCGITFLPEINDGLTNQIIQWTG